MYLKHRLEFSAVVNKNLLTTFFVILSFVKITKELLI